MLGNDAALEAALRGTKHKACITKVVYHRQDLPLSATYSLYNVALIKKRTAIFQLTNSQKMIDQKLSIYTRSCLACSSQQAHLARTVPTDFCCILMICRTSHNLTGGHRDCSVMSLTCCSIDCLNSRSRILISCHFS